MAAVSAVNLVIQKGTYFEETFVLNAEDESGLDLSNQTATAKLKKTSNCRNCLYFFNYTYNF